MNAEPGDRTPAVILATRPLGEADRLVVLLTPGRGKVRAAARHARNSRRRFPGGLPGGAVGEATVVIRGSGLARLLSFEPVRDHAGLGRDLSRFAYVAYLCELTDALLHEPDPDPTLFSALCESIGQTMDEPPRPVVLRRYELRLLLALGLLPALEVCAACGDPLAPGPTVPMDMARGGALCLTHGRGAPREPAPVLALAQRLVATNDAAELDAVSREVEAQAPSVRKALRDLTAGWLRQHLRGPLRSREFFVKLGPAAGPREDS